MVILAFAVQPPSLKSSRSARIMLGSMRQILGTFQAVFVTALMFMILHLSPVRFPQTLALRVSGGILAGAKQALGRMIQVIRSRQN